MWNDATITDVGSNMLAAWISGQTLNLSRAAAGSGTTEDLYSATALTSEKQEMSILSATLDEASHGIIVKLQAGPASAAYTMHEIGIWGNLGGNDVLLAIFNDSVGISIPAVASAPEFVYNFYALIVCDNTGSLTVNISTTAFVTMETLLEALADKQDIIQVEGMLKRDENGNIVAAVPGVDYIDELSSGSYMGDCSTAAGSATKSVQIAELGDLIRGMLFVIHFASANTAVAPVLKINSLAAHSIVSPGESAFLPEDYWSAGEYVLFLWDGTNFVFLHRFLRYIPVSRRGAPDGVAALSEDGKIFASELRSGSYFTQCSTAKGTAQKTVSIDEVTDLYVGSLFTIRFTNENTAATPTLKINNLPAVRIVTPGQSALAASDYWTAGEHVTLVFNGAYFLLIMRSAGYIPISQRGTAGGVATLADDGKVTESQLRTGSFFGTCATSAGTSSKACTVTDCASLKIGSLFTISFVSGNTASAPKLKINSLTARGIVSPGDTAYHTEDRWSAGDYVLFLWDGTNFVQLVRLRNYIPTSEKGAAGGVATLESDGKVTPSQLRGGYVVSSSPPSDHTVLWIDTYRVMRYYDTNMQAWRTILPTWG